MVVAVLTAAMGLIVTSPANAAQFCNTTPIVFTPPPPPGVQAVQPLVPYPSVIPVTGLAGTVTDVNVTFNDFTYPFPEDVDVLLVAPDGSARLLVMSDIGGNNAGVANSVTDVDLTFDDEAAAQAPTDSQLTSGSYRPTDDDDDVEDFAADTFPGAAPAPGTATTLSVFDGVQPNGEWRLYVVDDEPGPPEPGDFGGGWCLDITTSDTSTSSTVAPTSSTSSSTPTSTSTSTTMPSTSTSTSTSTTMPSTSTSTSTSTTMPSTSTSTSTSTTMPSTSTSSTSTSTTLGSTTTSTVPAGGACARILADRAAFNARFDAVRAALIQSLSGSTLTAALAQLEATQATGNAQFERLLEDCATPLPTTSTIAPSTSSTVVITTTSTVPPTGDQCAELRADRAAFNARITSFQAALSQSLSGAQLAAALTQLEGTRAQGNAQFASQAAALGCTL